MFWVLTPSQIHGLYLFSPTPRLAVSLGWEHLVYS